MKMLKYSDYFVKADKVSVGLQFVFSIILASYVLLVIYFTIMKTGKWQNMSKGRIEKERK